MRFLIAALFSVIFIATAASPGSGTRLNALFTALQKEQDPTQAGMIQAVIWLEWSRPPADHPGLALLMDAAANHIRHEEHARAIAALDEAIRIAPRYAEAWNRRATAFYRAGNYPAAAADIAQTLKLEPRHFGALAGLGMINLALGRMEAALEAYEAALRINPHLRTARLHAAAIRAAMKESL